jgi:nucleoside-diphosphate-sugar epimerase
MTLRGQHVLVTGGTGFIGNRLVEKLVLEQQARVRVLVRSFMHASRIARFPLEMVGGDIADPELVNKAVEDCQVVFHCAYDFSGTRENQKQAGVLGTQNLCQAVLGQKVCRMVHVSTFSVYAPMKDGELTEQSPWPPTQNSYTLIKREADRLVLDLHKKSGLPVVIVQPTLVYGPYSTAWTLGPVQNLKTGLVPLVNGGAGLCNAVYVDDVVDAMIQSATEPGVNGETFLISGPSPVTWREFYEAFESILGVKSTVDVPVETVAQAIQLRKQKPGTFGQLLALARRPDVYPHLVGLPALRLPLKLLKGTISDQSWKELKVLASRGKSGNNRGRQSQERPLHIPDEALFLLYQAKTTVRIDKARARLGYQPQMDFRKGMELTADFIRWANLR